MQKTSSLKAKEKAKQLRWRDSHLRLLGRKTKLAKQAKPKTRRQKTVPAKETENEKDRCDIAVKMPLDASSAMESSMFAGFCSIPAVDSTVRGGNKKQ